MYKANQEVLIQSTNQGLINLRQAEINYYVSVNTTFGTQAALIGGFTYSIFLQNSPSGNVWTSYTLSAYYICASMTIGSAVLVIVLTMLMQVLAPGLALHGPVGSMARAAEGMRAEQALLVKSFSVMMIAFTVSTLLAFWTVMDIYGATGSTIALGLCGYVWIFYSNRIIARFAWDQKLVMWDEFNDRSDEPGNESCCDDHEDPTSPVQQDAIKARNGQVNGGSGRFFNVMSWLTPSSTVTNTTAAPANRPTRNPVYVSNNSNNLEMKSTTSGNASSTTTTTAPSAVAQQTPAVNKISCSDTAMEGYLIKKTTSKKFYKMDKWQRFYFVLNYRGEMYFYKTRQDFRNDPVGSRMEGRPIELDEYRVKYYNSLKGCLHEAGEDKSKPPAKQQREGDGEEEDVSEHYTCISNTIVDPDAPVFQFMLVPLNGMALRHWGLKVDTEEEFLRWLDIMQGVSLAQFDERCSVAQ